MLQMLRNYIKYGKKYIAMEYGAPYGKADIPGFPAWDRLVCDRPGVECALVKKENGLIMEHGIAVPMDPPIREEIVPGLEAIRVSCDHHEGSLLLYCKEEKVLFVSDALYNGNLDWNAKKYYSSERFLRFTAFLDTLDVNLAIMGHDAALTGQQFRERCARWNRAAELSRGLTDEKLMLFPVEEILMKEYKKGLEHMKGTKTYKVGEAVLRPLKWILRLFGKSI